VARIPDRVRVFEQTAPLLQACWGQFARERQQVGAVGAVRGIPLDPEWIVSRPEKARPLARHVQDVVKQEGQGRAGHVEATMAPKIRQRAAIAGKELRQRRKQLAITAGQRSARQRLDSRGVMQTVGVMQTADQGGLVH